MAKPTTTDSTGGTETQRLIGGEGFKVTSRVRAVGHKGELELQKCVTLKNQFAFRAELSGMKNGLG